MRISSICFSPRSFNSPPCTTQALASLGFTSLTGTLSLAAMSSTVSIPSEMMPTLFAIALAVIGWSPVTIMTLIPAERHLTTASGTAALGGSIMDIRPTNLRPSRGKFSSSGSNGYPVGYLSLGKTKSQNPRTLSPSPPSSMKAISHTFLLFFLYSITFPFESSVHLRIAASEASPLTSIQGQLCQTKNLTDLLRYQLQQSCCRTTYEQLSFCSESKFQSYLSK